MLRTRVVHELYTSPINLKLISVDIKSSMVSDPEVSSEPIVKLWLKQGITIPFIFPLKIKNNLKQHSYC